MEVAICEYCGKPGDYPVCRPPSKPSQAELLFASEKRVKELEAALGSYWQAEHDSVKEHLQREYGEVNPTEESIKEFTCQCHSPHGIVCYYCAARKLLEAPHEP